MKFSSWLVMPMLKVQATVTLYFRLSGVKVMPDQWMVGLNWYPAAAPGFHIKAAYFAGQVNGTRGFLNPLGDSQRGFFGVPAANYDFDGWTVSIRRDW